ncbi:Protein phosphatase 2C-like protein [Zancudomyces culisetae]|uniref:Protein phosphatase 2C-like protein n=1 Tax=Zancudomyces culisetae TaxID=1213189 RepID=A0A1R1PJJ5_ZANCU|nr:Protein phosphatase 2C-like protein [Zancudomyces culisetae]|eukprot:OMH81099.1 Protein phosphatase 2C-like protein [Zancudomyces culisetae]
MKRQKDESIPEIINNSFLEADAKIKQECKARSGCTAVIAFVLEEMGIEDQEKKYKLYTANVGDARATLGRNEDAARMTYDHKGEDFQESLRITENGGFMINNRVNGVLAVTRALGDSTMKRVVVGNPYVTVTTLDKENDVLILACDGLWDVCTDEQAVEIARNSESAELASSALLNFAMDNLSTDNISIIVVRLDYFS